MGFEYDPYADGFIPSQELLEKYKEQYPQPLELAAACKKKLKSLDQVTSHARRQFLESVKEILGKAEEDLMGSARDYLVNDYIEREERSLQEAARRGINLALPYPRNSEDGPHRAVLTEAEIEARRKFLIENAQARSWKDEDLLLGIRKILANHYDEPTVAEIENFYERFRFKLEYRNSFRSHSKAILHVGQALPQIHSSSAGNPKNLKKTNTASVQVNSGVRDRFQQISWHGSRSELKRVWKVLVKLDRVTNSNPDTFSKQFLPHFQITSHQQPSQSSTYRPVFWKGTHLQLIALFWFLTQLSFIDKKSYVYLGAIVEKHFFKDGRPVKRKVINQNKPECPEDELNALYMEYENLFNKLN